MTQLGLSTNNNTAKVFSVSELNEGIKTTLERGFSLVWIKGEISNFKPHSSGHFYFSLKDSKAQMRALMFRGYNQGLKFMPENGMEVLVRGKVSVYAPRGEYQLYCELMEPAGVGALQLAFEQLKNRLKAEGLFDSSKKRPLPLLPQHLVLVTSPTGAAVRDMLHVLHRRFKGLRITIVPVKVQGQGAAQEIVAGIQKAQRLQDVDVMIVGRGGGSIEDLWAFNEEIVARAIAACRIPVISAVGHEVDFTIADFVADLRAPTPSAAAEVVVKSTLEILGRTAQMVRALRLCMERRLSIDKQAAMNLSRRLVHPKRKIQDQMQLNDELVNRLQRVLERYLVQTKQDIKALSRRLPDPLLVLDSKKQNLLHVQQSQYRQMNLLLTHHRGRLSKSMALLDSLSPLKVVERGYAVVTHQSRIVRSRADVQIGDELEIQLADGKLKTQVI